MTRPIIGVTVSKRSGWRIFPLIALNVWLAGGRAVKWQTAGDIDMDAVDGVIIGGGDDIGPELYGGAVRMSARLDPVRDTLEKWVLETAFELDMPVFGICRGAQMLNVVSGGALHQNAYRHYGARRYQTILPRRKVRIVPSSRLAEIVGPKSLRVNVLHRQSVSTLGTDLRVSAMDGHGMVQAIERVRDPFAIGVQWHPEHLFYSARHRALFTSLVTAADAYRASRPQISAVDEGLKENQTVLGTNVLPSR